MMSDTSEWNIRKINIFMTFDIINKMNKSKFEWKKEKNYKIKYNEQMMVWIGNLDSMVMTISNIFIIKPIGLDKWFKHGWTYGSIIW